MKNCLRYAFVIGLPVSIIFTMISLVNLLITGFDCLAVVLLVVSCPAGILFAVSPQPKFEVVQRDTNRFRVIIARAFKKNGRKLRATAQVFVSWLIRFVSLINRLKAFTNKCYTEYYTFTFRMVYVIINGILWMMGAQKAPLLFDAQAVDVLFLQSSISIFLIAITMSAHLITLPKSTT